MRGRRAFRPWITDIIGAIELIRRYTAGITYEEFRGNQLVRDGVERNIEKISEAARHLPEELTARHPDIPWHEIRAIGNIYRHEYFVIDPYLVWGTVKTDLDQLLAAMIEERARLQP